jgi:uncharacterized membrane protein YeaQ/YmgE (transglycosylase-associated protein family)
MGLLSWLVFGLIAGAIAKSLMPGDHPRGCLVTSVLGIVGSLVGGFVGTQLGFGTVNGFDVRSFGIAVLGTVIVLLIYRELSRK